MQEIIFILLVLVAISNVYGQKQKNIISNPINNGYFADPSIVKYDGAYHVYICIYKQLLPTVALMDQVIILYLGQMISTIYCAMKFNHRKNYVLRQLCLNSLNFNSDGSIRTAVMKGVKLFFEK